MLLVSCGTEKTGKCHCDSHRDVNTSQLKNQLLSLNVSFQGSDVLTDLDLCSNHNREIKQ